ncbi:hypothetical protein PoB_001391700 [Plakobranchus ocellatus]|uniref:Uncharacterized protein n=1 Tax=Plakobranchus ocellatus TaxID=259542 RepID=A0AAV3YYZ0_9GAST|nr:hypothetical protein PoB_001391700 [Plakobranchus ocellatus]
MSHLLEKQYKRGERARKKNKQEERKMVHEISGKNGLRALHEYRVEMVTREQRKVAEELERIREGLRMNKGQRWNAGARHKEAKRSLHAAANATPRGEQPTLPFTSARQTTHHHGGKLDAFSSRNPMSFSDSSRLIKSGPFLTDRRPAQKSHRSNLDAGAVSNPVSGRREKKVPRLQLHGKENYNREDAVTSSRSVGYVPGVARGDGSSSDDDSDSEDFGSEDEGHTGRPKGSKRPPDPEILKAILKGVVQCWEETVVATADLTSSGGGGGNVHTAQDNPPTVESIHDLLSPRAVVEKDKNTVHSGSGNERNDNALSLALLRNMQANNVDCTKQIFEKRSSSSSVQKDGSNQNYEQTGIKSNSKQLSEKLSSGDKKRLSARSRHSYKQLNLPSASNHREIKETVEEYVANISKDLPVLTEIVNSIEPSTSNQHKVRKVNVSGKVSNHVTKLPQSAHSTKSSKVSEHASNLDRVSQKSYGRHVRTTHKDFRKQENTSRHGSGRSTKTNIADMETTESTQQNSFAGGEEESRDKDVYNDSDIIPQVSFRLPPLKKLPKSESCKSARSSVSSVHGGSDLHDIDNDYDDNRFTSINNSNNNSNTHTPLPQLRATTATSSHTKPKTKSRNPISASLPRLPLSASVSSTPRLVSQTSTHGDAKKRTTSSALTSTGDSANNSIDENTSIDLQKLKSNPAGGIRYKKKLHVYQGSPRGVTKGLS